MLDTMWAYQFQVQPKLTLEDGKVQLPCQEVLWEAKTASQWHHVFQYSPGKLFPLISALLIDFENSKHHARISYAIPARRENPTAHYG